MPNRSAVLFLAASLAGGCAPPSGSRPEPVTDAWATYASPDGRMSFEHPAGLVLKPRPRADEDDPDLMFSMTDADGTVQVTFLMRVSGGPAPAYTADTLDAMLLDPNSSPASEPTPVTAGAVRGVRREYDDRGGPSPTRVVAVGLSAGPRTLNMTAGYVAGRPDLRPVCERIVGTLRVAE